MSAEPKPVVFKSLPPPKTKSGELPAVKEFRKKLASIAEGTIPALEEMNRKAANIIESEPPPPPPAESFEDEKKTGR